MFQKTVRGVLLGLMMMLFLTSGIVICGEQEAALANSYQNPEHGFALDYSEGWSEAPSWSPEAIFSLISPDQKVRIEVWAEYRTEEATLDGYIALMKSEYFKPEYEIHILSEGEIMLEDGTPAYEMLYTEKLMGTEYKTKLVVVVRKTQCLGIYGMAPPADFDANQKEIEQILASFRLLPLEVIPTPPLKTGFHKDEEYNFSISFPKEWRELPMTEKEQLFSIIAPEYISSVRITLLSGAEDKSLANWGAEIANLCISGYTDFKLVSAGKEIVLPDGIPAYEMVVLGSPPGVEWLLQIKWLMVKRGTDVFWIRGFSTPEKFAEHEPIIDEIIQSFRFTSPPEGLPASAGEEGDEATSSSTSEAAKDEILLATSQGVSIIGEDGWSVLDESKGLPHNRVNAIAVDKEARIWLAHGRGLSVLDQGEWDHYLRLEMFKVLGFSINEIDALACDAQGRVWVGTDWELAVFDGNQWLTYTQATSGLVANGIRALACIGDGPPSLPLPGEAQPGSISGKMICQEEPVAGVEVNICWDVSWPIFFGPTPCIGEVYKALTDSEGQFSIVNIPPGAYKLAIRIKEGEEEKWHTGGGIGGVPATLHIISGEEANLGKLSIKKIAILLEEGSEK